MSAAAFHPKRVDWVDYAKGIYIIMVVMMHSTLGVEKAAGENGWLNHFIEFARPFRMPDFFLISGLFLSRVIGRDWRTFFDRRILHFVYFYVLWVTIQFVVRALGLDLALIRASLRAQTPGYLLATWEKLAQRANAGNPLILLVSALGLEPRTS